ILVDFLLAAMAACDSNPQKQQQHNQQQQQQQGASLGKCSVANSWLTGPPRTMHQTMSLLRFRQVRQRHQLWLLPLATRSPPLAPGQTQPPLAQVPPRKCPWVSAAGSCFGPCAVTEPADQHPGFPEPLRAVMWQQLALCYYCSGRRVVGKAPAPCCHLANDVAGLCLD
ncbi:unnamed protein product, partial [Polarella glacialis]